MTLSIKTQHKREVIDITEQVAQQALAGSGIVHVFVRHTTCAVMTMDMDPGMGEDLLGAVEDILPHRNWKHPHNDSYQHVTAHLLASLIGPSISVPFTDGKLQLGVWQRIVLIEFNGPRERQIAITILEGR